MNKYISLIGLGVVGAPLASHLADKYKTEFILLSSSDFLNSLHDITINGLPFAPNIISEKKQLKKRIGIVFVCTKNYHIEKVANLLEELIDDETIIVPLQNGLYSFDFFANRFPENIVLEGYAQGPNTEINLGKYSYERAGEFHIGTSKKEKEKAAKNVVYTLREAGVDCFFESNIKKMIWKKLMLNVSGNYVTALTETDYCDIKNYPEIQSLLRNIMHEYIQVAVAYGIDLNASDVDDIINYFNSFKVSKKTSMLMDIIKKRKTENDYIAGYVVKLAQKRNINTPLINFLYRLVMIKESIYSNACAE